MGLPQRVIALSAAIIVLLVVSQLSTLNSYLDFNTKLELTSDSKIDAQTDQQSVAFCVLAKDEKDLYEWIDYHRQLGVSKFYVMDEYSDPPLKFLISEFIDSGLVEYKRISFFWSNFLHYLGYHSKNHLRSAFDECLHLHGHKHQWLGFLDADEFVILKDEIQQSLPQFLSAYEEYGGLVLNWMMFGSSGHISRPKGGILRNYFRCVPNGTIKTIVQSKYAVGTGGNCHYFQYKESYYGVNSNMTRVDSHWSDPALINKIYINHYKTKSIEDFNYKLLRWGKSLTRNVYRANLRPDLIYEMDASMTMNCSIPQLKEFKQY